MDEKGVRVARLFHFEANKTITHFYHLLVYFEKHRIYEGVIRRALDSREICVPRHRNAVVPVEQGERDRKACGPSNAYCKVYLQDRERVIVTCI